MNRRTFLAATPTAAVTLASLKAPLFVPVDWYTPKDFDQNGLARDIDFRCCDYCENTAFDDAYGKQPFRQFFLVTDQHNLCVCEHCIGDYLSEEP